MRWGPEWDGFEVRDGANEFVRNIGASPYFYIII